MRANTDRRWWALLGLLVLVAHASLFGVGPVGEDFEILAQSSRALEARLADGLTTDMALLFEHPGTSARPLTAISLQLSTWLWAGSGVWTEGGLGLLRFENLALLFLVAHILARFLRRLVAPWVASDQAAAAGQSALLLLMVHPLAVSAVATPLGRGDLLGGALALAAAACFLRGRQERKFGLVVLAVPLTLLATEASELGYLLPLFLAGIEYFSSRRKRAGHVRLRTAITTALVFGAVVSLDVMLRLALGVEPWPLELEASLLVFTDFGDLWFALLDGLTKLGVLILPVNVANAGGMGFVVAGVLIVAVVQPALHAGLSAPRFWLTVLCSWLGVILLTEATRAGLQVGFSDFSAAAGLFPAVVVMAMGLALASTAVSGSRRQALPIIIACLLCSLARSNARGWRWSARQAAELSAQGAELLQDHAGTREFLVLDAPGTVDLFESCPENLAWMFDHAVTGSDLHAEDLKVRALSQPALLSLARLPEFDSLRAQGLVALYPIRLFQPAAKLRWVAQDLQPSADADVIHAWRNPDPDPESQHAGAHWVGERDSAPFFADPAAVECLTIRVDNPQEPQPESDPPADPAPLEAPEIYWRARGDVIRGGVFHGVWLRDGTARTAVFDPASDLAWLLGHRVDSLLLMGELAEAREAEIWSSPPQVPNFGEPEVDGDDWYLGRPSALRYVDEELEESWSLSLLDLISLEQRSIECTLDDEGALLAPDAEELSRVLRTQPGSLAWGLERRVGDLVLQRVAGRF